MTERELMSLVFIQRRIAKINERIEELEDEDGLGAMNMDGMPHSKTPGNPVERMALARAALHEMLLDLKADLVEKELEIRKYIESVELDDIKFIMECRFIDGRSWQDIAVEWEETTGKYADRTTLAKKVRKYLFEHPN
jgi:hypothetical protein